MSCHKVPAKVKVKCPHCGKKQVPLNSDNSMVLCCKCLNIFYHEAENNEPPRSPSIVQADQRNPR
jgi:endogenous inhibitor of DNA gyrase (YacG/DUF329 family)